MSDFGTELVRLMAARGIGVRQLAREMFVNPGHISNLRSGKARPSRELAAALDEHLGAGGTLVAAGRTGGGPAPVKASGGVLALRAAIAGDADGADFAADGLDELARHYAYAAAVSPSADVYAELMAARTFAGDVLSGSRPASRSHVTVTAGWLSSLLAVSAVDLGDHAAAVVWCADAERQGRAAGYPELLGWAALTRSAIAWYQGDPFRAADAARRGQAETRPGTVAYAKLAAQEMRCMAAIGDFAAMADARRRAAAAMEAARPGVMSVGVYSIPRADDPPYTATSLLHAGKYRESADMTRGLIETVYRPQARTAADQPTNYARTLLILALAAAGLGDADEAAAAGAAALECGRVVWPTMMLAGRLDQSLARQAAGSAHAADFRARYVDAGRALALPAADERNADD